jgi:Holliday junction resolvasome RuvABC ATP-dependent DNA helicase subunit
VVALRAADALGYMTDKAALKWIAIRSHGTPRVSLRQFRYYDDVAINPIWPLPTLAEYEH